MKRFTKRPFRHQKGAVAIIVALCAIVLFAFMGIALDLGQTYNTKTDLQNAADAAALAGAKELNDTVAGVRNAEAKAIAIAQQHTYHYSTPVSATSDGSDLTLWVGACPKDSCMVLSSTVTTEALAAGKTFIKVETGLRSITTNFMRVAGAAFNTIQTFGSATAGHSETTVSPIAVCAIDPNNVTAEDLITHELLELGFRRGVSYDILALNPLGSAGTPYLLNPVDNADDPDEDCAPNHSSTSFTAPFICDGKSSIIFHTPAHAYLNTGVSAKIEAALNSRFDVFGSGNSSPCIPSEAPPDVNVKEYKCTGAPGTHPGCATNPPAGSPRDWMGPAGNTTIPTQETISIDPLTNKPLTASTVPPLTFSLYGVLWSYSRAVHFDAAAPHHAGTAFGASDWPTLYGPGAANHAYPEPSPYAQNSPSDYFKKPTNYPQYAKVNRRVLNIAIINCNSIPAGALSCRKIDVLGIGRFFMLEKADLTGHKTIQTEFAGLTDPEAFDEIKLYSNR